MDFNAEPFWDDFAATRGAKEQNYVRILFRPGYAVQARELTQIQSIIQNQIRSFGDHIFQDGSPVSGGHISLRTDIAYIKLDKQYGGNDIDLDNFFGTVVFNSTYPKSRARVIQTYSNDNDTTLLVKYISGPGFSAGDVIQAGATNAVFANIKGTGYTGQGSVAEINFGIFYVDGFFVQIDSQSIVLDPYSKTPTYRIGLEVHDVIIGESEDNALLDPAQESFNYQAPGAHRYQHNLVLAKRTLDSVDDKKFIELLRVEDGAITKQVSYPIYSELEKTLARRTYDESGDYTVRQFNAEVTANVVNGVDNTATFNVNLGPGKAYVKGREFETIASNKLAFNRARTTKQNKGFNLSVYYGNRVLVDNVTATNASSILMSESLNDIDIHCVPNNAVSLTGATDAYYATRIGTAKVRNFDRPGSDANMYYLYLTEANFDPIISTANGTSVNAKSVNLKSHFTGTSNAYQNGVITLINTTGASGNSARIIDYNGTTKVAVVDTPFDAVPQSGDKFSLTLPTSEIESFVIANTNTFLTANLQANVSYWGKDLSGNTNLEDIGFDQNIFDLPNHYIQHGSDQNVSFYRRLIFKNQGFAGGNGSLTIQLPAGHKFDYYRASGNIPSADVKENIIIVANNGTIIDMTTGGRSVTTPDDTKVALYTNSYLGTSFMGDVYLTAKVTDAATAQLRGRLKTKVTANATLTQYDKPTVGTTDVVGYGSVKLNLANGIAWFTNANSIVTSWGDKMPLYVSDVIKIRGIYDSANLNYAPNTLNASTISISNRYLLDNGQNDNFYDYSSLRLKPGAPPPTGQVAVLFDRYDHSGSGVGYISSNSYPVTDYNNEQIPVRKTSLNDATYLRDAIDFRPYRPNGTIGDPYIRTSLNVTVNVTSTSPLVQANLSRTTGNTLTPPLVVGSIIKVGSDQRTVNSVINTSAVTVSVPFSATATNQTLYYVTQNTALAGSIIQRPTDPFQLDYTYYLPRIDKIVVTKDKEFKAVSGIPATNPAEPTINDDNEMHIYTLFVPPFTPNIKNIKLKYIENKRYTMKNISELENRLIRIENYVNIKDAESKLINDPPTSAKNPAIVKPIYGTLVDDFNNMTIADQTFGAFAAAMEAGVLTCYKLINEMPLLVADLGSAKIGDKFIMPGYTEEPMVSQLLATLDGPEQVVPDALSGDFSGYVTLSPESDYWYIETVVAQLPPVEETLQVVVTEDVQSSNGNTSVVVVGDSTEITTNVVITVTDTTATTNVESNTTTTVDTTFTGVDIYNAFGTTPVYTYGYANIYPSNFYDLYINSWANWSSTLGSYIGRIGGTLP